MRNKHLGHIDQSHGTFSNIKTDIELVDPYVGFYGTARKALKCIRAAFEFHEINLGGRGFQRGFARVQVANGVNPHQAAE